MDLIDALRGTGAVRAFTDEPGDDSVLARVLDIARFAPSGGNRQPWRVAVVKDPELRHRLADAMTPVWDEYAAISATGITPFSSAPPAPYELESKRPGNVPNQLLTEIATIPVVLAVAADLTRIAMMDKDLDRSPITGGASVYPFCWNVLLAARSEGLGGVITTFASRAESVTGPLLGLPEHHALAATIFLGHPVKQPTRLKRHSVDDFATVDRFDGAAFPHR
ncbi:MAG: nitroreductase family protein [Ilumatobacteraceae bacterium]